jgi:SAM-dependent methyltransferase
MKSACISEVVCPSQATATRCSGQLALVDEFPIMRAEADPSDVLEGLLRCQKCQVDYPIICGVLILLNEVKTYLAQTYGEIISTAGVDGISRTMASYLQQGHNDLFDAGHGSGYWLGGEGVEKYTSMHYDDIATTVDPSHPLADLLREYSRKDFYSQMADMASPVLTSDVRALDVGCNVGGMVSRLSQVCGFIYGLDVSFRSVAAARRILLGQPVPQRTYRLHREGVAFDERNLSVEQRRNVELLVASGTDIPFAEEQFDFVSCVNIVDIVSQPELLLQDMERVLKRAGCVLLADPYYWRTDRTPMESWFGVRSGQPATRALRAELARTYEIIASQEQVPWLLRDYDRHFEIWINDCVLAKKR